MLDAFLTFDDWCGLPESKKLRAEDEQLAAIEAQGPEAVYRYVLSEWLELCRTARACLHITYHPDNATALQTARIELVKLRAWRAAGYRAGRA